MIYSTVLRGAALAALLLAGCANEPKVRVDQDANVDIGAYRTFAWHSLPKEAPRVDAPADSSAESQAAQEAKPPAASMVDQRVQAAIIAALQTKGYVYDASAPDFRVNYVLNTAERAKRSGMSLGLGAGGGSGHFGGGVGLSIPIGKRTNTVGGLSIDIVDAKRNAQVWTGFHESALKGDVLSDADAAKLANTILEKFPARR